MVDFSPKGRFGAVYITMSDWVFILYRFSVFMFSCFL